MIRNMQRGRIIKVISNQYTIESETETIIANPRGKMRLSTSPVCGDIVNYEYVEGSYRIDSIEERKNRLIRPAVSNVDQALIVTSIKDPDYSSFLLNRLIFLASLADVEPVICITKYDLNPDPSFLEEMKQYSNAGYKVVFTHPGSDDSELKNVLQGKISVLCGQSGAGKSSLLNRLDPSFELHTQAISKALGRGKHTTRVCELHHVADGLVADTPGFSSLDFTRLDLTDFDQKILDFKPYLGNCRFKDCRHIHEPDCAIKIALDEGKINPTIYRDYKTIVEEKK